MNRELKFRVWDTKNEEFLEDYQWSLDNNNHIVIYNIVQEIEGTYLFGENSRYRVQQYTGIKDKNGKEIYEGDILVNICDQYIYLVSFNNDNHGKIYSWNLLQMTYYSHTHGKIMQSPTSNKGEYPASQYHYGDSPSPEYHTIVGNIFENKELMK